MKFFLAHRASVSAGAMSLQGERKKDDKHATYMGLVCGVFVPLAVAILGLWRLCTT